MEKSRRHASGRRPGGSRARMLYYAYSEHVKIPEATGQGARMVVPL